MTRKLTCTVHLPCATGSHTYFLHILLPSGVTRDLRPILQVKRRRHEDRKSFATANLTQSWRANQADRARAPAPAVPDNLLSKSPWESDGSGFATCFFPFFIEIGTSFFTAKHSVYLERLDSGGPTWVQREDRR